MNEENQVGATPAPAGLKAQIDLPAPVAVWVFAAHAIALLSPLLLLWAVHANWDYVAGQANAPGFFYLAVAFMMASGSFEFAQNTSDRWYLRAGMGSTTSPALADFLFYMCNALSMLALITACMGVIWWLLALCVVLACVFAFLYLTGRPPYAAFGVLGFVSTLALFFTFDNPIVFLQLVTGQLTLYFFTLLLKTRAQSLHGCVALVSTSGLWVIAWAIYSSASGRPPGWVLVVVFAVAAGVLALALKPRLGRLKATPQG
ncbi:MAG: hypothetical protein F4Y31_11015 [Gammaproteobacteria bacterium]|nr:hypothetical protein [Gammaproteobacteria bacterium]MYF66185.1 hypothetical protein [Gammaproteobacteria bacterium]MYK38564.1 hypothetical protein [Gammaproteobacteria bacterium]